MAENRSYLCIDMKSFYASVECADLGLNPFETNLVVADLERGKNALCLAISPKLKALGVRNRCRVSEIPPGVEYIAAKPRMKRYIDCAADIYALYLNYFDPRDMHVYSIDETFIDATPYLGAMKMDGVTLAKKLTDEIARTLHIPATAGVGTNLYLAKIALDITAKHTKGHIGWLNEERYRQTLWDHRPITDFWQISHGTERHLDRIGIRTMRDLAMADEGLIYKNFGVNAELMIDHAWGRESCRMSDIKEYKTSSHSLSFSQILPRDYSFEQARTVMEEMVIHGCQKLMERKEITRKLWIGVGYSHSGGDTAHASLRLTSATNAISMIKPFALELFDETAGRDRKIRRLALAFNDVCDESCEGYDFFTDWDAVEREKKRERAVLEITKKHGKNAVLHGISFLDGATQRERNEMIGGHRAGYDDESGTSQTVHAL